MSYPKEDEEQQIIEQNIALKSFESYKLKRIINPMQILKLQQEVHKIKHSPRIKKYIVNIVNATRSPKENGISSGKYIWLGASPRASINLFIAAKANALMNGNQFVVPQNVKNVAHYVLRHRIKLNYKAKVENVTTDDVIEEILNKIKVP